MGVTVIFTSAENWGGGRRGGASRGAVNEDLNLQLGAAAVFTSAENGREGTGTSREIIERRSLREGRASKMNYQLNDQAVGHERAIAPRQGDSRAWTSKFGNHSRTDTRGRASSTGEPDSTVTTCLVSVPKGGTVILQSAVRERKCRQYSQNDEAGFRLDVSGRFR